MKFTKELLIPVVLESVSVAEVLRKLGYRCLNGGTHFRLTKNIKKFGIDTSHFLGQGANHGVKHRGGPDKLSWQSVLVLQRNEDRKENTCRLRRAMIDSGISHECGTCHIGSKWNDKILVLQISHRNGNSLDNRKENLMFECPNCHSQTEDFGGRGRGKNKLLLPDGVTGNMVDFESIR